MQDEPGSDMFDDFNDVKEEELGGDEEEKGMRRQRSKERKKIFYRDKMAELLKPGEYVKQ